MRKTKKYRVFSIEEKNQIVLLYLDRHMGRKQLIDQYGLSSTSQLQRWIKQYQEFGTCVDQRGKATNKDGVKKGRPKKYKVPLEALSKEQLIEKVEMYEDIKKSIAYLTNQQQN